VFKAGTLAAFAYVSMGYWNRTLVSRGTRFAAGATSFGGGATSRLVCRDQSND